MQMDNILKFCEQFQNSENETIKQNETTPFVSAETENLTEQANNSAGCKPNNGAVEEKTTPHPPCNLDLDNDADCNAGSGDKEEEELSLVDDILSLSKCDVKFTAVNTTPKSKRGLKSGSNCKQTSKKRSIKSSEKIVETPHPGLRRSKREIPSKVVSDSDEDSGDDSQVSDEEDPDTEGKDSERLKPKSYSCEECPFTTGKLKSLSDHKRDHLHNRNVCSFCYLQMENPEALKEHLPTHTGPQPFFCTVCEISFKTRTQLNLHRPKHSSEKPFVCEICNAGFKWKHALKSHMIVHSGSKDQLCDICGFSTAHKSQLKAHKLIHTGDTFKCTESGCSFQATKRQNLKYHMLTHTMEKPHQCYVCGQSFSLAKNMKRHMLLHDEAKPLQCSSCQFTTTRHDKLKDHCRKQHGIGEPPEKRHRISDYQPNPDDSSMKEEEFQKTSFIQISLPAELSDQSMIPIAFSTAKNSQNPTVEYLVSSF